jgi:hypothetical protein
MRKIFKRKEGKKSFKFQVSGLAALNSAASRVKFQVLENKTSCLAPMETASFYKS